MDGQLTAALKERAQLTGAVRNHMQGQVDACRAELHEADKRKAELQAAIDSKREPIALARQRYHMRKQRPVRELVHDEVEDALTQEFHDLQVLYHPSPHISAVQYRGEMKLARVGDHLSDKLCPHDVAR